MLPSPEQRRLATALLLVMTTTLTAPDEPHREKPFCQLSGTDGNVFAITGKVSSALKRAGQQDRATEFNTRAMNCDSYDAVLQLCFDYVEVG